MAARTTMIQRVLLAVILAAGWMADASYAQAPRLLVPVHLSVPPDSLRPVLPPIPQPPAWDGTAMLKLGGSQAVYRNWSKGGANTLALSSGIDAKAVHKAEDWEQTHEARLAFGVLKQEQVNFRKADDEIRLHSTFVHTGENFVGALRPTAAFQLRTQFAEGLDYKKDPPQPVSDFLSPLILTQSVGLTYGPRPWFSSRLGVGTKATIVADEDYRTLYEVDSSQVYQVDVGLESRTRFERVVFENVSLKSSLGLFLAANDLQIPDLQWENLVVMKVNSWLGVNLQLDTLYDADVSKRLQVKEVFSLGFSFALI